MKKAPVETSKSIPDKPDYFPIIMIITMILFSIVTMIYVISITSVYSTETKIIKIQYASSGNLGVVDTCGHPTSYSSSLANNQINLSDVYEIDVDTTMFGEKITHFQLLDKEKYVEKC